MRIALLGPTEIDGGAAILGRRDRVILTALALRPGAVLSADQLAEALWGDEPPPSWPKVVQGSVLRLRRTLGRDVIQTTSAGYRLLATGDEVDVSAFERLVSRGRHLATVREPQRAVTAFEEALGLWRGRPFPELEKWEPAAAEAERLHEVRRAAEEDLVEARLGSGHPLEAVGQARSLVAREGLRERRWMLLALALYRSGRQPEALEVVRRATATLRDELGLDPGPALMALEQAMLRQDPLLLSVPDSPETTGVTCPYRGLLPFHEDDAEFFFGRAHEVDDCLARLAKFPLLVVVGPSGGGKSSLVRAGIVPRLQAAGQRVHVMRPGVTPLADLAVALGGPAPVQVLVVDQLEELLVARLQQQEAVAFLDRLASLVAAGTVVIATLRADHVGQLAVSRALAAALPRGLMLLTPLDEDALRSAVQRPAKRVGLVLEPGLVELLLQDALDAPGGLPLLSHALVATWEARDRNVLTVDGYRSTGGIRGAVALSAERLYESLSPGDREVLRSVLLRLVLPLSSGDPVTAAVPTRVFAGSVDAPRVLDLLVRARLVTVTASTATMAHEALVRAWPRLRDWLDEDREGQQIMRHLQLAAEGWEGLGHPADELYRGGRLQTALDWSGRTLPALAPAEAEFLAASLAKDQDERRRQQSLLQSQIRRNRELRGAVAGVAVLLVAALIAGFLAVVNAGGAKRAAARARVAAADSEAGSLAAAALVEPRSDTALLLAREAFALKDTPTTRGGLLGTLVRESGLLGVSRSGEAPNPDAGFAQVSPDGRHVLTNTTDGVTVMDAAAHGAGSALQLADTEDALDGIASHAAGFLSGGRDALVTRTVVTDARPYSRELAVIDIATSRQVGAALPLPGAVAQDAMLVDRPLLSPDGRTLVSVVGHSARVWRRTSTGWAGPQVAVLPGTPQLSGTWDLLRTVSFSTDGRRAAVMVEIVGPAGSRVERRAFLVDLGGNVVSPTTVHAAAGDATSSVALSGDGATLAVGDRAGWVELRDLSARGLPTVRLPGLSAVTTLAWSADDSLLVVGCADGSLSVYGPRPLRPIVHYSGLGTEAVYAAFAGTSTRLVSQDGSGAITTYATDGDDRLTNVNQGGPVSAMAVGPAGTVVALGHDGGRITVVDQRTPARQALVLLLAPPGSKPTAGASAHRTVSALAITADGTALVAGDRAGRLQMWSLPQGKPLWSTTDVGISALALSPDGSRLATVGFEQDPKDPAPDGVPASTRFTLWDLRSHQRLTTDLFTDEPFIGVAAVLVPPKPRAVAFSEDGRQVAAGFSDSGFPVFVYDAHNGRRTATLARAATSLGSLASLVFSPDGSDLLVRDEGGLVVVFDLRTGREAERFSASPGDNQMVFSADHRWLIGSSSRALDVWDARSHQLVLSQLRLPSDGGSHAFLLAVTGDNRLFVATQTKLVDIDFDSTHWGRIACALAGRPFNDAEIQQYLPGRTDVDPCR